MQKIGTRSLEPQTDGPSVASNATLTRRRVFAGAGTVGALAALAAVVPLAPKPAVQAAAAGQKIAEADVDGYQETAHVLRYYQTARV